MNDDEEFFKFRAFAFNMLMSLRMFDVYAKIFQEDFERLKGDKEFEDYSPLEHDIHDMTWHVGDIQDAAKRLKKLYEWYFIENKERCDGDTL